jgi:mRNA m6A methyltransferase non-catalytic subunit
MSNPIDPTRKPPEMYTLIENFCLGTRRLELFGRHYSLRQGWVTAGDFELSDEIIRQTGARSWNKDVWDSEVRSEGGRTVVPVSQG